MKGATLADLIFDESLLDLPERTPMWVVSGSCRETAFNRGAHRHAYGQLMGTFSGLLSLGIENRIRVVPAIHAAWLPPQEIHCARSHGPFDGWSVFIAPSACADLPAHPRTLRVSGLLREAIARAATWPAGPLAGGQEHLAAIIREEIRTLPVETFGLPLPTDPRLQRIAEQIISHPADDRSLEAWAQWAAISSRTLSRRFVAETGFNFTEWRQRARLLRALELLAAGESVTRIALKLGYATASSFINLFRRTFGETPKVHCERLRQGR